MSFLIDPPRLGFRTRGPVRHVPWYLFLSSSRGCFVICERPEAPQAVGTPHNPINQASLTSSVTSFIVSYRKRYPLVSVDSLSRLSIHTWAHAPCHAFTGATHSGRGGFKTCLPQCQSSFSVQIRGHLFYEPSPTHRDFPVASFPKNYGTRNAIKLQPTYLYLTFSVAFHESLLLTQGRNSFLSKITLK